MKIKLGVIIATALFFVFFGSVSASYGQVAGGYGEADVKDKDVIKAAKFAVQKRSKMQNVTISLRSIKKAQVQVVAGLNYELCLEVTYGKKGVRRFVKTVVYRNLKRVHSLTSWTFVKSLAGC